MQQLKSKDSIKLFVCDLDGTLLDNRGELPFETAQRIKNLRNQGVNFTVATGRMMSAALLPIKEITPNIPMISLNGCLVACPEIFHSGLDEETLKAISPLLLSTPATVAILHRDTTYMTDNRLVPISSLAKWIANVEIVEDLSVYLQQTVSEILVTAEKPVMDDFEAKAQKVLPKTSDIHMYPSLKFQTLWYCEIRNREVNKGNGMAALISHLGLTPDEVLVAGDYYNDTELFEYAVHRAAPANAVDELKAQATYVSPKTCDEGAVVDILNHYFPK